jgi:hypothetical protein
MSKIQMSTNIAPETKNEEKPKAKRKRKPKADCQLVADKKDWRYGI